MDLLDRINSLTDDQLQMVAERDDASGVLASYRLAELRGLPMPDRETVILGEGYVIVAQSGQIQKIPVDTVEKIIRQEEGQYCVYSEDGSRSFGCYDTMSQAEERLRQIHFFRQAIREGSFVSWNSSGGRARGQVEHVMYEGVLGVPDSEFSINAEEDDPAVLIRIWREFADGWQATETLVGHKMSTLTRIEPLSKATKREDGEDFPPEAFAYVPDPESPSTWKLRLWDSLSDRETRAQVGRAVAALSPGGFRGNRVQIPADDLAGVKRRVAQAWRKVNEDDAELPAVLKQNEVPVKRENGMDFPAMAYAYVPDPESPATWALRVWETPETRETREQIGRALENIDSVRIPASDVERAQEGIRRALQRLEQREGQLAKETFVPPEGVQEAAQRALEWIGEGHAGSGFTDVGRARAAQLARGDAVSEDTIRRMASYLARHEGDSRAEGFNAGEDGFPSPGRVAWDAWGGDAAVSWTRGIVDRLESAEKDYAAGLLTPRQRMMYEKYEWIAESFGPWDGGVGADGAHYITATDNVFKDEGLNCANCVFFQGGGGCEILNMPVEPDGVCKLWIIPEESLDSSRVTEAAKSLSRDGKFLRKQAASRFTLGPLYVPDFMDAHGEWTDAEELQQGVWEWVRSGDRTIYLQHDRSVRAGEWVEVMTMPQPWTVNMVDGAGNEIGQVTYPAGTVFLGVIWDEDAWKQIVAGELRGYSIGGFSDRVLADLPEAAVREGIELEQAEEPSLAKSIADAVALAMRDAQPVVNVVMPEQGKATKVRRIERDEHGNIARIIEEDE